MNTQLQEMIPLSLYIHFPWCIQKCPYCDFNSHSNNEALYDAYMATIHEDLMPILPKIWGRSISSIFIGGGTPSLMPPKLLEKLFSQLRQFLTFTTDCEVTLEANPGTAEVRYFEEYYQLGVNRLSIGVQSLNDERLKNIGRIHNASEAVHAVEMAQKVGFKEINCDLMFALPNQSVEEALTDLDRVIALNPTHISHYQLTLEPNTYFYKFPPPLPKDEAIEAMQVEAYERLAMAGYEHYEVSAFAQKGSQCRHNINYWEFGDYIGIGAGAHGKITLLNEETILRTTVERHPRTYVESNANERITLHEVEKADLPFEFMLNTLRLKRGVPLDYWAQRTQTPLADIKPRLDQLVERGLITLENNQLRATDHGFLFLNSILEEFL